LCLFFFSSRRRHTSSDRDWSSDVCSSDLPQAVGPSSGAAQIRWPACRDPYACSGPLGRAPASWQELSNRSSIRNLIGVPLLSARLSPTSFPLPNALQRTPARLRTKSLPRGSRGTQELFVATRAVAGIIKKT